MRSAGHTYRADTSTSNVAGAALSVDVVRFPLGRDEAPHPLLVRIPSTKAEPPT